MTSAYCGCASGTCPRDASCPRPRLLPQNRAVLAAWWDFAATQWRVGMAGATGLDYAAVQVALQAHRPRGWKRLFRGIRVIESAMLRVFAERAAARDGAHDHSH